MGMEKKQSHEMGAALDRASRSCVLFRTASVFMQKRVQRTLQVSEGGTDNYLAVPEWRQVLTKRKP